eukprot:4115511-Amphidinium_carterae.2
MVAHHCKAFPPAILALLVSLLGSHLNAPPGALWVSVGAVLLVPPQVLSSPLPAAAFPAAFLVALLEVAGTARQSRTVCGADSPFLAAVDVLVLDVLAILRVLQIVLAVLPLFWPVALPPLLLLVLVLLVVVVLRTALLLPAASVFVACCPWKLLGALEEVGHRSLLLSKLVVVWLLLVLLLVLPGA